MTSDLLDAALRYASRGLRVLPVHYVTEAGTCSCGNPDCRSGAKHPVFDAWTTEATTNEAQIRRWWQRPYNIGIATGAGHLVLDVDTGGEEWLHRQSIPPTWAARTGGNGLHYWFALPAGVTLGCSGGRLAPHVDTRADGGMVVAPPSRSTKGLYEWLVEPGSIDCAPAPPALVAALQEERPAEELPPTISTGRRNELMTSLAGSMRRRGATAEAILAALVIENERCQPPLDRGELRAIAASVARYEPEKPLHVTISAPPPSRWLLDGADLMAMAIEEPAPLVGGAGTGVLIAAADFSVWHGAPRSFKSLAALTAAVSVATGEPFAGHFPTIRQPVFYIQEEGGASNWQRRLRWCLSAVDAEPEDLRGWFRTSASARFRLDDGAWLDALRAEIEEHRPGLLIIDPLSQVSSHDENDATETGALVRTCRDLQSAHGVSVVLVAHDRKDSRARRGANLRGSSALWAAAGTVSFDRDEDGTGCSVVAELKDAPPIERFGLSFTIDGETMVVDYAGTVGTPAVETAREEILAALAESAPLGMTKTELLPRVSCGRTRMREALVALENARLIDSEGRRGSATTYRITAAGGISW